MDMIALKNAITSKSQALEFTSIGFASAAATAQDEIFYQWIAKGYQASMAWIERHIDKRLDPTKLVPGTKSIIVVTDSYFIDRPKNHPVAMYAQGIDYHTVFKQRLWELFHHIKFLIPDAQGRVFCDSAPLLEHYWAWKSGIGWIGKNTLTLHRTNGSFQFLGEILLDLELPADLPATPHCGSCTKCIESCPTGALESPYLLNANKCISYLSIEHRGSFSPQQAKWMDYHIFGCDICQDVCPWNKKIPHQKLAAYGALPMALQKKNDLETLVSMTPETFKRQFGQTPLMRPKKAGIDRNIQAVLANHPELGT